MSDLTFGEARNVAQDPTEAIALGLVLLDRIATALEDLSGIDDFPEPRYEPSWDVGDPEHPRYRHRSEG